MTKDNNAASKRRINEALNRDISVEEFSTFIRQTLIAVVTAFLCNLMLNISMTSYRSMQFLDAEGYISNVDPASNAKGFLVLFVFLMTFISIVKRGEIIALLVSTFSVILSLVNHYEIELHGAMFTTADINNAGTVANVFKNYTLHISPTVIKILVIYAFLVIGFIVLLFTFRKSKDLKRTPIQALVFAVITFVLFTVFFSPFDNKKRVDKWSWEKHYLKVGYISGTIDFTLTNMNLNIKTIPGYNAESITPIQGINGTTPSYPDIIFIINESWYDLDRFSPTEADVDYLSNWHSLEAQKGYAVIPLLGGGTNDTEYELLTSNAGVLIPVNSPFSNMDFDSQHSIVDYLEGLGYSTMAAHPAQGSNYRRAEVWPQFGFDQCYFADDFTDLDYYGDVLKTTDSSAFNNFTRFYEAMPEDQPRFGYLLTIQNHSPWTYYAPEQHTVHVGNDTLWSENRDVSNEFLSSMELTNDFMEEMIAYFESSDRDVIVVMVGDHCPSLLVELLDDKLTSYDDSVYNTILLTRETPFFIWSNYQDIGSTDEYREMDVCCLAPEVLRIAGLPLSPYYSTLSELSRNTICFTNLGVETSGDLSTILYFDSNRELRSMSEQDSTSNLVQQYYYMEYNNIGDPNRNEFFFSPPQ